MVVIKKAAQLAIDGTCRVLGRRHVVRASRFALNRSRLDTPNSMSTNGETALQAWVLAMSEPTGSVEVIDVGANTGEWSCCLLAAARRTGRTGVMLRAFEPSAHTCGLLREALKGQPAVVYQRALSDRVGEAVMSVVAPAAGTNSLHPAMPAATSTATETVSTTTLDVFAAENGITHVHLLKVDTEGHDLHVLRGAGGLFGSHSIDVAQFEYNHRWIYARAFLRDVFELLAPTQYEIGKLTPRGVEFYPQWDPDLETFVEGNYIACTPELRGRLPQVRWWKTTGRPPGATLPPGAQTRSPRRRR